jgi:hypothetical protein
MILKERHPSQIVFKLKLVDVDAIHRLNAEANKLLGEFRNFIVLTDNLPVEIIARRSAFAPEHDKHRFV